MRRSRVGGKEKGGSVELPLRGVKKQGGKEGNIEAKSSRGDLQ